MSESNLDMNQKTAYLRYDERYILELVYRQYKNDHSLDQANVKGYFCLIGSKSIVFIAPVASCRLIAKTREAEVLSRMSYIDPLNDLSSAWKMVDSPTPPRSDNGFWAYTITCVSLEAEALGLSIPVQGTEPKKRGLSKKEMQEQKRKAQEDVQGKILNLPSLYSTADWETFN